MKRDQLENSQNSRFLDQKNESSVDEKQSQINFMEQFIQEKYAQVKDLQKYLVEELQLIENNKKKQGKITQIINNTLTPTVLCLRNILEGIKAFILSFNRLEENSVLIVAEKCKDLLAEKQHKCQKQQGQILKLKMEVINLQEQLKHSSLKTNLSEKGLLREPYQRQEAQETEITFNRNFHIEKPTRKVEKTYDHNRVLSKEKQTGNSPYRLHQESNYGKERTPLNERKSNISPAKNQQNVGSSFMNKTININYRCQRPSSTEKLIPSRSTQKLTSLKIAKKLIDEPLQTRKDYIKQKIQNLKQKNTNFPQNEFNKRMK